MNERISRVENSGKAHYSTVEVSGCLRSAPTISLFLVGERVSDKKAEGVARASVRTLASRLHSTTLSKVTTLGLLWFVTNKQRIERTSAKAVAR
jgi:hypothetical protein